MDLYYSIVSPPCQTVLLVGKKLGITFNLKETNPHLPEVRENLKKINPQHTIPTLVDDGHVMYESYAIVIYLIEKYGKDDSLYPKDPKVRSVVNQRLFFDNGLLFRSTIEHVECLVRKTRQMTDEIGARLKKALGLLESYVTERQFAAADHLTIADICMLSNLNTLGMMQYDLEAYPGIKAWQAKVTGEFPDYAEFQKELVDTTMKYVASLQQTN